MTNDELGLSPPEIPTKGLAAEIRSARREREQLKAKLKYHGKDLLRRLRSEADVVKADRGKQLRWTLAAAAVLGVGVGLWLNRRNKPTGRNLHASDKPLTGEGLQAMGFSNNEINRILVVSPIVDHFSLIRGVDPNLILGIIWAESRFNPTVTSPVGAAGLMQIMPTTQKEWETKSGAGVGDIFDPFHNVELGTWGVKSLLGQVGGDVQKMLAAYNWGIGNVSSASGVEDYPVETQTYIVSVPKARTRFAQARAK